MSRRGPAVLALLGLSVVLVALVALDASRRAVRPSEATVALAGATGLFDLFLSSGSRWLRHPSITEPAAALADAPDGLDTDPGGLSIPRAPERAGVSVRRVEER